MQQTQAIPETRSALARVALAQGRPADAMALVDEILSVINAPEYEYAGGLPPIYGACYQVLRAADDDRAASVLHTAHNLIQKQAASIGDEALRESFLNQVMFNREIVGAYERLDSSKAHPTLQPGSTN
jgi:hypothetical protein